jgi:hypothetical protein
MKKLSSLTGLIFLFLLALSTIDCKKEKTTENPLIGKWNAVSSKITYYEDNVKTDEETINFLPGESAMEFLADGTGKSYTNGSLAGTFNWEVDGDLLIVTISGLNPIEAKFTIDGNTMTSKATLEETSGSVVYKTVSDAVYTRA